MNTRIMFKSSQTVSVDNTARPQLGRSMLDPTFNRCVIRTPMVHTLCICAEWNINCCLVGGQIVLGDGVLRNGCYNVTCVVYSEHHGLMIMLRGSHHFFNSI